jgi:hypothetical protein
VSEWVSEWLLFNAKWEINFSPISWRDEMMMDWLAQNQDNVLEWSDISIHRLLFQWVSSTIKIQLGVGLVQSNIIIISSRGKHANRRSNTYQFVRPLVWPYRVSNPRTTALETRRLTITPPIQSTIKIQLGVGLVQSNIIIISSNVLVMI